MNPLPELVALPRCRPLPPARLAEQLRREVRRREVAERSLATCRGKLSALDERSGRLQGELRELARRMLSVQEEERKRISRELHDEIGQRLAGISMRLSALRERCRQQRSGFSRQLSATQRLVQQSASTIHDFARDLRPAALDDLGLIPALRSVMKSISKQYGLQIHFKAFSGVETMDSGRRTVLYRVAQEALTNVGRHAQATEAHVEISLTKAAVQLEVRDNGRALVSACPNRQGRLGLLGMRERVLMVGGTLAIESGAGHGTTVRAEIPFRARPVRKIA